MPSSDVVRGYDFHQRSSRRRPERACQAFPFRQHAKSGHSRGLRSSTQHEIGRSRTP